MGRLLVCLVLFVFFSVGCTPTGIIGNIGDGKVDPIERAIIRISVAGVLARHPELVTPAYAISTGLKVLFGNTKEQMSLSLLEQDLKRRLGEMDLSPEEQRAAEELILLVKEEILKYESDEDRRVVLYQLIQIVNDSARFRLHQ